MTTIETRNTSLGPVSCLNGDTIVLSAPHEAEHVRESTPKIAEVGTAKVAFDLASIYSCAAISALPEQTGDANWDIPHPYFDELLALTESTPKLVIDFHMMKPRGVDICLGLGPNKELADGTWQILADAFLQQGLTVSLNWPFPGGVRTITGKAQDIGIRAIQIEMSWDCYGEGPLVSKAFRALEQALATIVKHA